MMMLKMFMPSVPKMPGGDDGEKKEESAESREEAKEQVGGHDDADADADDADTDARGGQKRGIWKMCCFSFPTVLQQCKSLPIVSRSV